MQLLDQHVIFTPADLTECDFALVRQVAELRGLLPATPSSGFLTSRRKQLSQEQRARTIEEYRRTYALMFTEIPRQPLDSLPDLEKAAAETTQLLRSLRVVAGGTLLHRVEGAILHATPPVVMAGTVADTVLERFTRAGDLTALGALAYTAQIAADRPTEKAIAHLNNGRYQEHNGQDLVAIAAPRIAHVGALLTEAHTRAEPWPWGDDALVACGFCPWCRNAAAEHRDTQLVWGIRRASRNALAAEGITTLEELAHAAAATDIDAFSWSRLHARAQLQLHHDQTGEHATRVHDPAALAALPSPSPGDIFFDFEGDPLWVEKNRYEWGLEFLFGYIEADTGHYTALWSTTQAEEKRAFTAFLDYLRERRTTHPDMHVYHFAFYEPQTMRRLARRHKVGHSDVKNLLDEGVFVDLYETVKTGVHFSGRSYGLKALEPLYMGEDLRTGAVGDGAAAVDAFTAGIRAKKNGKAETWEATKQEIADYNRYDCLSTLRLRDWLLEQRPVDTDAIARELLGGTPLQGDLLVSPLDEQAEDLSALPLRAPEFDEPGIFYIASGTSSDALGAEHKTHELLGRWGSGSHYGAGQEVLVVYSDPAASPTDTGPLVARRAEILECDPAGTLQRITLREATPAHDPATHGLAPAYLTSVLPVPPSGPVLKAAKRHRYTIVTGPPGSGKTATAATFAERLGAVIIDDAHGVTLADAVARIGEEEHVIIAGDPAQARPTPPRALPEDLATSSILNWLLGESGAKITQHLALDTSTRILPPLSSALQTLYPRARFAAPPSATRVVAEEFTGLRIRYVDHWGNRDSSPEEAAAIAALIPQILDSSPLDQRDIIVSAGSTNQALLLRSALTQWPSVRVLPHESMDGESAALVVFSLGVSTFADLPAGQPPFAPHVLTNVLGRAREGAIIVCSPRLATQLLPRAEHIPAAAGFLRLLG